MPTETDPAQNGDAAIERPRWFATTHWSIIARAAEAGSPDGHEALEALCRIYWSPLYAFARRRGLSPADAEDLTQAFFADLLARDAIARADAARGRFRNFLLASFCNFQSRLRTRAGAQKRGGDQNIVSLDALHEEESRLQDDPATDETPEKIYERKWAASLLGQALEAVRHEYAAIGKGALYEALKPALWQRGGGGGHAAIAQQLGMSEGAVKVAVHRLRKRFGEQLREEVSKTVLTPEEAEDELRHLLNVVSA